MAWDNSACALTHEMVYRWSAQLDAAVGRTDPVLTVPFRLLPPGGSVVPLTLDVGVVPSGGSLDDDTATWKTTDTNTASNWAMPHGAAARYNGGVHVAQGLTNQDFAAKFATTKYSILGADYRL